MEKNWLIADLHIHSRFSRACSSQINIPNLVKWARIKGLGLLGTGDFTHPEWLSELKELREENGLLTPIVVLTFAIRSCNILHDGMEAFILSYVPIYYLGDTDTGVLLKENVLGALIKSVKRKIQL